MSRLKNTGGLRKVTPQVVPHTEGFSEKFLEKRPAVSYFRVSTKGQADEDKSGLDRQDEAMNEHWIGKYGAQYEIIDKVSDFGVSSAKQGRFDWFVTGLQKGEYEPGPAKKTNSLLTLIDLFLHLFEKEVRTGRTGRNPLARSQSKPKPLMA